MSCSDLLVLLLPNPETNPPNQLELTVHDCARELLLERKQLDVESGQPAPAPLAVRPRFPGGFQIVRELLLDFSSEVIVRQRYVSIGGHVGLSHLCNCGRSGSRVAVSTRSDQRGAIDRRR